MLVRDNNYRRCELWVIVRPEVGVQDGGWLPECAFMLVGMEIWQMPGISEAWTGLTQPEFSCPFLCIGPVFRVCLRVFATLFFVTSGISWAALM